MVAARMPKQRRRAQPVSTQGARNNEPDVVTVACVGHCPYWHAVVRRFPSRARSEFFGSLDDLAHALHLGARIDALLVCVDKLDRHSGATVIREAAHTAPRLPVIAVAISNAALPHLLIDGAHCGLTDVIVAGHDDVAAILNAALRSSSTRRAAITTADAVAEGLPPGPQRVIQVCLLHGADRLSVDSLARMLGVHRRSMSAWLQKRLLPTAGELISWGRLVAAAYHLDRSGDSVERIALDLGFASASGLHNMIRRYTGLTPTELRRGGAERAVLEALRRALGKKE